MTGAAGRPGGDAGGGRVRPVVALVFATILFVALVIGGIGILSLYRNEDPIAAPEFGILPGVIGVLIAAAVFAGVLWTSVRREHPSFWGAVWTAAASFLAYVVGIAVVGAVSTGDPVLALGVSGRLVTQGFAVIVAASALVSGWGGIALVRTRGGRPRWPWEDKDGI
jgi:hypothetical protein